MPAHQRLRRRGVMLVVVMGLLALVLAVTYAMTRSQFTAASLQDSSSRAAAARQAAATGLSLALRKMHESGWTIDDEVTGRVSSQATFVATYATGDPRLAATDADYASYPYRVTITARGIAADPNNADVSTERKARAIVELIPRKLGSTSSAWQTVQQYTVYQYKNETSDIHFPARIEGKSFFQGTPRLNNDYPDFTPRKTYLEGLNALRKLSGQPDYRPLNGPIHVPLSRVDGTNLSLLRDSLELSVQDIASNTTAPVAHPGAVSSYKLYSGGKSYEVADLPFTVTSRYEPDPLTNPLGVFHRAGTLQLNNGATIRGTVILSSDSSNLEIVGTGVSLASPTLPSLEGSSDQTQLPVLVVKDDIVLKSTAQGTIRGFVMAWDKFSSDRLNSGAGLELTGRLVTSELELAGVNRWTSSYVNWSGDLLLYNFLFNNNATNALFPVFMQVLRQLDPKPVLTMRPDASDVKYHWQNWANPLFVPHADDPGLRWKLLVWNDPWEENP